MKWKKYFTWLAAVAGFIILICFQDTVRTGVQDGIRLSVTVLLPSLFPLMVACNTIMHQTLCLPPSHKATGKARILSAAERTVFLLSLIGGYPAGATLLSDLQTTDEKDRRFTLLPFAVHPGPGLCIGTVGGLMFHSTALGFLLFFAETAAAVCTLLLFSRKLKKIPPTAARINSATSAKAAFESSLTKALGGITAVCAAVIFFSGISSLLRLLPEPISVIGSALLEITGALRRTENIYAAAFLLGFGGFSVYIQICAVMKARIQPWFYFAVRIVEGLSAVLFTKIGLLIFPLRITAVAAAYTPHITGIADTLCLWVLITFFLASISFQNSGGNLRDDMLY